MALVYVWEPRGDDAGHVSVQLNGAYVSWWPSRGVTRNLAADKAAIGSSPNLVVQVIGLNEANGSKWWLALLRGRTWYSSARNGSWAVVAALRASGADDRIPWTKFIDKYNLPTRAHRPMACAVQGGRALGGSSSEKIEWVDECTPIWTPKDVLRYVRAIR